MGIGLGFVAPVASIAIECLTCRYDNPSKVGGLGLISVTPWVVFVLAFMLSASFALVVMRPESRGPALTAHVAALSLLIPGLPGFLEQYPRFSDAWLHVGFVQAIIVHKHPIVGLDARFSWPGFFTGIAAVVGIAHLGSALPLIRWTPLVLNLAYALEVFVIARVLLRSSPRVWVVTWLFILTNWVGQDYFSPQGMAYLIFLGIVAVLLKAFGGGRPTGDKLLGGRISRIGSRIKIDETIVTVRQESGLLAIAMLSVIALSMEHQLTPVALALDVCALVLANQISARFFAAATVLSVLVWVSYGAVAFWRYHFLTSIFGGGGGAAVVQSGVASRVTGSTAHEIVVYERILFSLVLWGTAGIATVRGYVRRSPVPLAALILALVPFVMLGVQSYGGEAVLRVYLYTLPFMLIVVVAGLADLFPLNGLSSLAVLVVISTVAVPLLLIARFGNEQFEQITSGDVAAARYVYSTALPGAAIWTLQAEGVLGFHELAAYRYETVQLSPGVSAGRVLRAISRDPLGTYLVITPDQVQDAIVNSGAPEDWATKLESQMAHNQDFKLVFNRYGGRVYEVFRGL